jgi:hypothetical protein
VRRWIGRWPDRRLASAALLVAAVVIGALGAATDAPESLLARRDPVAARQLVVLMARGEQVDGVVDYTFTRSRPPGKQTLSYEETDARWGRARVTRASGGLTVSLPTAKYVCASVDVKPSCAKQGPDRSLPASEVTAVAIGIGAYDVVRVSDTAVAGELARCFRVRARSTRHMVPGLGRQAVLCLAKDGVPLRTRVDGDTTDEYRATHVSRHVDQGAIEALLAGFDQPPNEIGR